ncbi:heavy-metal-associated domain-containing protein [Microbacterium awajiense]|uniref:Heavy-metal-associated domain-containing protein n=1 Tax=Microbacterium awajiense TaxID=415214 RepID=A0ABP7AHZ2_9MICO
MTETREYRVTGMTCGHCERAVRSEVSDLAGVDSVAVDAETGMLRLVAAPPVTDAAVLAAVDEAGYRAERV